jgi:hypothetical protein
VEAVPGDRLLMTLITFQNGKVVMRDGQVGTEQECCCEPAECCAYSIVFPIDPDSGSEQFRDWDPSPGGYDKRSFYESGGIGVAFQWQTGYPAALGPCGYFWVQDRTDGDADGDGFFDYVCRRWRLLRPDCETCTFIDATGEAIVGGVVQENCNPADGFLNDIPTMECL